MGLNEWKKAEKALNNLHKLLKDPKAPQGNFTSVFTREHYEKQYEKNNKQIRAILEDLEQMEKAEKTISDPQDPTSLYQKQKIHKIMKIGKSMISNLLNNK